jgi:hypothetical protein
MSWSASGTITSLPDSETTMEVSHEQPQTGNGAAESKAAIDHAKEAALAFVQSGKLGHGRFAVQLSGHSNDGNKPQLGWVNDCVTISITQQS